MIHENQGGRQGLLPSTTGISEKSNAGLVSSFNEIVVPQSVSSSFSLLRRSAAKEGE